MIDDEGAVRLLEPLRGDPDVRTVIDVPRAMAEGLRRRRLRRWSSGVAALAVTAVAAGGGTFAVAAMRPDDPLPRPTPTASARTPSAAAAPVGPASCAVTRLPTAGVKKALATAGDPSGRWAAGRLYSTAGHPTKLVVWKDGAIDKQVAMPGSDATFGDLNSAGHGLVTAYGAGDHESSYFYQDGRFTRLRGSDVSAGALNEAGVIVGGRTVSADLDMIPVRWASATAAPQPLPLPASATNGSAGDIAEDGTILGSVSVGTKTAAAYLWFPDGTGRYLPVPKMRDGTRATSFVGQSISNGWVAGSAVLDTADSSTFTPVRYRIATGEYEFLPRELGTAARISADGWIVGEGQFSPVLVAGTRAVKLPPYGPTSKNPGEISYDVRGISADGAVIVGYKAGLQLTNDPLMWTCR
ncbi:hypothetical protein L3i22_014140 [Actinoplanes sp. L3-i22]|nr:hypothetical protein L3i22_014140 [Actinoplanes sp. L3-i22]